MCTVGGKGQRIMAIGEDVVTQQIGKQCILLSDSHQYSTVVMIVLISIICFHKYGVYLIRVRRYAGVDSAFLVKSDLDWDPYLILTIFRIVDINGDG